MILRKIKLFSAAIAAAALIATKDDAFKPNRAAFQGFLARQQPKLGECADFPRGFWLPGLGLHHAQPPGEEQHKARGAPARVYALLLPAVGLIWGHKMAFRYCSSRRKYV